MSSWDTAAASYAGNYGFTILKPAWSPQPPSREQCRGAVELYAEYRAAGEQRVHAERDAALAALAAPNRGLGYRMGHTVKPRTFVRATTLENSHIHHDEPRAPPELNEREWRLLRSKFRTKFTFGPPGSLI